jgi:hypothetical protein
MRDNFPMKTIWCLILLAATSVHVADVRTAENCLPFGSLQFLCGPESAEDLIRIGKSPWLLAGGLAEGEKAGRLYLIDTTNKQWEAVYPTNSKASAVQTQRFPNCNTEPDPKRFSAHGIALRTLGGNRYELLVAAHGGREAIEFFDVRLRGRHPTIQWIGCVPMPADTSINSVVPLPGGGFLATKFYAPSQGGITSVFNGKVTGGILEWHPGGKVLPIPGTEVSGANGIEISNGGRTIFVAAWGKRELVRFSRNGSALTKETVQLDFAGDNLRWSEDHQSLLVAGQKFEVRDGAPAQLAGWTVARVNPQSLAVKKLYETDGTAPMQGISVAVEVDDHIWVGPFRGDRVGYFGRPLNP